MEEISNNGKQVSSEDLQSVVNLLMERELAQQKRRELSEESFKEWVYDFLKNVFVELGYAIVSFEEFWVDVSLSIKSGWKEGVELAHREAEFKRKKRARKNS